jgi:short-subunit dehydrogenase
MPEITVKHMGDMKFEALIGNHKLIIDVPPEMNGKDRGPTAPELFITSLASCITVYATSACNNAGIDAGDSFEETRLETFREVMETNFFGAVRCMHAVLPDMRRRRSGCIVNISSLTGRVPTSGASAYCASKAALEFASEALAAEVAAFDVRVALIEPGLVLTPIFEKRSLPCPDSPYADLYRRSIGLFPKLIERGSTAEETAEAVAHAILTDAPRLRYLVGWDAETVVAHRAKMTDEEFIAMGRCESDADFYASFHKHFGIDVGCA